ncbi:MAG: hypothetical protein Q9207_004975 [Kuettlingeria erythrocarpa]
MIVIIADLDILWQLFSSYSTSSSTNRYIANVTPSHSPSTTMAYNKPEKTKSLTKAFEQRASTKRHKNSKKRLRMKLDKQQRGQLIPSIHSRQGGTSGTAVVTERTPQADDWHERDGNGSVQSLD